jgi:serine/threonine protein kinase
VRRLPTLTTDCESWDGPYRRGRASMHRSTLCSISRQWLPSAFRSIYATPWYRIRRPMPNVSTMSTSPYKYVHDVERLDCYQPGGYHPITIGEKIRDRYTIVHKLGFGSYSTTWLARDEQLGKYVAIKIGTSDHISKEIDLLSQLSAVAENTRPGRKLIPSILDRFVLHGPNGTHPCSVTAPARCSLAEVSEPGSGPFQLCVARSLAAQLAVAVAYIHHLGYVHGGEQMKFPPGGISGHL